MKQESAMELLAPAGSLEAFSAAVAAGADAIYIGAPALNARALAKQFSLAEIAAMIDHAHGHGVKVYVAMNSLMKEAEIPAAVRLLAAIEELAADAVILQDLGVYGLAREHFPKLRLHASTLLFAHNSMAVHHFAAMGFQRVVLAREVTTAEIRQFRKESPVELEVFVQGAMCFSYSGLCLFSSYLGGKSGLRGRCVQPCRRRYTWQGKKEGGYLFSMNDLSALRLLPELKAAGVGSLKLEGRMRSAQYVAQVVAAYRLALDQGHDASALAEAERMLGQAMGRKATVGYFRSAQPGEIITPQHSGNIGIFLGRIERVKGTRAVVHLRDTVRSADRLRLHGEGSGERQSFTLKELRVAGKAVAEAQRAMRVEIGISGAAKPGDSLYKVDVSERRSLAAGRATIDPRPFAKVAARLTESKRAATILAKLTSGKPKRAARPAAQKKGRPGAAATLPFWLKVDDLRLLAQRLPAEFVRVVALLTPETHAQYQKLARPLAPLRQKWLWALPPVILEADLPFYAKAVGALRDHGFAAWQLGHVSQVGFFAGKAKARSQGRGGRGDEESAGLHGDYRLNVLNSISQRVLATMGLATVEAAVEIDRESLTALAGAKAGPLGLMLYGRPPLFTARLMPRFFRYDQPFVSPKNEVFELRKAFGQTVAVAQHPFSLLPFAAELAEMGIAYGVVDLSLMGMGLREAAHFLRSLAKHEPRQRLSTFNYRGTLP